MTSIVPWYGDTTGLLLPSHLTRFLYLDETMDKVPMIIPPRNSGSMDVHQSTRRIYDFFPLSTLIQVVIMNIDSQSESLTN